MSEVYGEKIPRAAKLPLIRANEANGHKSFAIWTVENRFGLWREVHREGRRGLDAGDGNVLAIVSSDDGLRPAEFARWKHAEDVLGCRAGMECVDAPQDENQN